MTQEFKIHGIDEEDIADIPHYMDMAIAERGFRSERDLAKALNVSPSVVNNWKKRKNFPTDGNMVAMAEMAWLDPDEALLVLNYQRATRSVRPFYLRMLALKERVRISANEDGSYHGIVPAIIVALLIGTLGAPSAYAGTTVEQMAMSAFNSIPYATILFGAVLAKGIS